MPLQEGERRIAPLQTEIAKIGNMIEQRTPEFLLDIFVACFVPRTSVHTAPPKTHHDLPDARLCIVLVTGSTLQECFAPWDG